MVLLLCKRGIACVLYIDQHSCLDFGAHLRGMAKVDIIMSSCTSEFTYLQQINSQVNICWIRGNSRELKSKGNSQHFIVSRCRLGLQVK